MFLTLKRNYIITFILFFIVLLCSTIGYFSTNVYSPKYNYTIVIDAGHGGLDVK